MSMKNSNDTIGNRTRNLPACMAVPQPRAPPEACPAVEIGFKQLVSCTVKLQMLESSHVIPGYEKWQTSL